MFYKEVKYEEVRTIVVIGARNQWDGLGKSHRHVLHGVEPDCDSLGRLGTVAVSLSQSVPKFQSLSESLSEP